jgi:hypothetical protein
VRARDFEKGTKQILRTKTIIEKSVTDSTIDPYEDFSQHIISAM